MSTPNMIMQGHRRARPTDRVVTLLYSDRLRDYLAPHNEHNEHDMSFMAKKKRFKFQVNFEVEELSSVPFISGILFCKVRLIDGGTFSETSNKEEVRNHVVRWQASHSFQCKLQASASTGELESCMCRVSVRKEIKGGKSYQKLGYADVNLAEFAGSGRTSRRFILEGYDSKRRQDNSVLKINIGMSLLSGDPLFKVPQSAANVSLSPDIVEDLQPANKCAGDADPSTASITSRGSSGFGSLPRKQGIADEPPEIKALQELRQSVEASSLTATGPADLPAGHARTSSLVSNQSKGSGYSSSHSRNSSVGKAAGIAEGKKDTTAGDKSHHRTPSAGSLGNQVKVRPHARHKPALDTFSSIEKRVDATRISADDLVNELIAQTDFEVDESAETSGLQLYIGSDGQVIVGGQHDRSQIAAGHYERVVIDKK